MQSAIVCPKGDKADAEKLLANTQKAVLQLQGTITSLHGPGARLSDGPSPEAEQKDIETFRRVKLDLDPKGILNPDTAWPSIDL
jgi:D-lactate dehydrogenase (cytochrome)